MSQAEVMDYFRGLADRLSRPLVIYNAPWVCNMLTFENLRALAEHPRIVGVKDVTAALFRPHDWPRPGREALGFRYLMGNDMLASAIDLGADGFVSALADAFPEVAVAIWDAMHDRETTRAFRLQAAVLPAGRPRTSARCSKAPRSGLSPSRVPPPADAAVLYIGRSTRTPLAG